MSSHCHKEVFSTSLLAICGWSRLIWLHCAVVLFRQQGWIPPKLSWSIFNVLPFFTNVLKSMAFWNLLWQNDVAVQINVCPVWRKLFLCCSMVSGRRKTKDYQVIWAPQIALYFQYMCTNCVQIISHPLQYYSFFLWFLHHLNTNSSSFSGNPSSNHLGAQF